MYSIPKSLGMKCALPAVPLHANKSLQWFTVMTHYDFLRILQMLDMYYPLVEAGYITVQTTNYFCYYEYHLQHPQKYWIDITLDLHCSKSTYYRAIKQMSKPILIPVARQEFWKRLFRLMCWVK